MQKTSIITVVFLLIAVNITAQQFGSNPASTKWFQINTDTARIIFTAPDIQHAQRIANVIHLINRTTDSSIGNARRKINMLLQNQATIPNAYVRMAPFRSELNMTPGADNFSNGSIRWDDNLSTHEYRHVQQFMNFNKGLTKAFYFFLGEEGQLLANGMTVPDYFFEGDAVFQETLVSSQGRGRMPFFFNDHKSIWQAGKNYSWMRWRNGSLRSLSPDHYPTGYMIVAYGYEKFRIDFWKKVTQDATAFKELFYPFNKAVEKYSGVSYRQFVKDAFDYFKKLSFTKNDFYTSIKYLTKTKKNNVVDYFNPQFIHDDEIIALKKSYDHVPEFIVVKNGNEKKVRVKDIGIDDYFSYRNGRIVYSAYTINARWGWNDYSDIRILNVNSGEQKKLTRHTKYFNPDINEDGTKIIAVNVKADGSSELHLINANTGAVEKIIPNEHHYFFTQTKFINDNEVVSAVRAGEGEMLLIKMNLSNGSIIVLKNFFYNVIGYPFVKNNKIYFSVMQGGADRICSIGLNDKEIKQLTDNDNGVYQPAVNDKNQMVLSVATVDGYRIAMIDPVKAKTDFEVIVPRGMDGNWMGPKDTYRYIHNALGQIGNDLLSRVPDSVYEVKKYKKSFQLFNFHSRRPVYGPPEYGYSFFSDNMLNNFNNILTYTYNENERSHKAEWLTTYGGFLPVLYAGADAALNRQFLLSNNNRVNFNSATAKIGAYIPLSFVSGRTSQALSFGGGFNAEQLYYTGIGKNILDNRSFDYLNFFFNFSSASQKAKQHIFPRWAQSFSLTYRDALTFTSSYKFVATGHLYFPGLFPNHNLVVDLAYQKKDTLGDIFSNTFPFSRGYESLRTRRMYKLGANYHFPILYPDLGFANMVYIQRIRGNAFFDYTNARARLNGVLQDIPSKTVGGELYLDGKIWNALPVSIGLRYNYLLDKDLLNPGVKNVWEIILPIGLIPE
ncbi:MAG: hypothetical protein ABJA78_00060 [Ferruginibacter sp.]